VVGEGILKGLAETARNFFGSYVSKDRLTTVQYPEQREPQIEATRDFPVSGLRWRGLATGNALCRLPDLRKRVPAKVHLHRKKQGQEARCIRQAAVLPSNLQYRHLCLHELSDLR
jgi:hypothetical protein